MDKGGESMRLEMNNYLTKKVVYLTYQQFLNELEELKNKYYVIGYTVKSQENTADVQLVEKEEKKGHEEI
jgi:hypothetical protein